MSTKNVFVTIVGKANVGKSSLLNAFVGEKVAAVSSKPQTTRTKITGVLTKGETQFVFIDTPGVHKARTKLSEFMNKTVAETVADGELILFVADCTRKISDEERELANRINTSSSGKILVINKIDLLPDKEKLINVIAEYSKLCDFDEVVPVSVTEQDGLDIVSDIIEKNAVEGPHYFPDDSFTDQPEKVIMAEIIREKALYDLEDEVPHGIAVTIEKVDERDTRNGESILDIDAVIYCEKQSHKGIIIGKNGSMLKTISTQAREELEDFFRIKVNLHCWVKVKEGWRNREGLIRNFGLEPK